MDLKEYQKLCKLTAKKDFKNPTEEAMCWGLGVASEVGEVCSSILETFAYNKDVKGKIKGDLGDTFWYMAMICNFFNWNMEEILKENIEKLKKRFPEGFSYESVQREIIKWSGTELK